MGVTKRQFICQTLDYLQITGTVLLFDGIECINHGLFLKLVGGLGRSNTWFIKPDRNSVSCWSGQGRKDYFCYKRALFWHTGAGFYISNHLGPAGNTPLGWSNWFFFDNSRSAGSPIDHCALANGHLKLIFPTEVWEIMLEGCSINFMTGSDCIYFI